MKTLQDKITAVIEDMSSEELVSLNNAYCQSANYSDDEIYNNDEEFFNVFFENKVIEAVRAASYGDYSFTHDYVKFNGYGNLESMSAIDTDNLVESVSTIAEYVSEHQEDFDMFDFDELTEEIEHSDK